MGASASCIPDNGLEKDSVTKYFQDCAFQPDPEILSKLDTQERYTKVQCEEWWDEFGCNIGTPAAMWRPCKSANMRCCLALDSSSAWPDALSNGEAKRLIVGTDDGSVFDLPPMPDEDCRPTVLARSFDRKAVTAILALPRMGILYTAIKDDCGGQQGGTTGVIQKWNAMETPMTLMMENKTHRAPINCFWWDQTGSQLLSGSEDCTVRRWRLEDDRRVGFCLCDAVPTCLAGVDNIPGCNSSNSKVAHSRSLSFLLVGLQTGRIEVLYLHGQDAGVRCSRASEARGLGSSHHGGGSHHQRKVRQVVILPAKITGVGTRLKQVRSGGASGVFAWALSCADDCTVRWWSLSDGPGAGDCSGRGGVDLECLGVVCTSHLGRAPLAPEALGQDSADQCAPKIDALHESQQGVSARCIRPVQQGTGVLFGMTDGTIHYFHDSCLHSTMSMERARSNAQQQQQQQQQKFSSLHLKHRCYRLPNQISKAVDNAVSEMHLGLHNGLPCLWSVYESGIVLHWAPHPSFPVCLGNEFSFLFNPEFAREQRREALVKHAQTENARVAEERCRERARVAVAQEEAQARAQADAKADAKAKKQEESAALLARAKAMLASRAHEDAKVASATSTMHSKPNLAALKVRSSVPNMVPTLAAAAAAKAAHISILLQASMSFTISEALQVSKSTMAIARVESSATTDETASSNSSGYSNNSMQKPAKPLALQPCMRKKVIARMQ